MVTRPCCVFESGPAPALSFPLVVPGADVAGSGCDAGGGGFALAAAEEAAAAGAADVAAAASAGGCGGTAAPAPAASLVLISTTAVALPSVGNYSYFYLFCHFLRG